MKRAQLVGCSVLPVLLLAGGVAMGQAPTALPADPSAAAAMPGSAGDVGKSAGALFEEACDLMAANDLAGAVAKLTRSLALDPSVADAHKALGICYAKLSEPKQGAVEYQEYLRLAPDAEDAAQVHGYLRQYRHFEASNTRAARWTARLKKRHRARLLAAEANRN